MTRPKYVASCSGGKDSVATLLLAAQHNEPLDEAVFSEVMFDKDTSGEVPEHRDFIYDRLKPFCEKELGIKFTILHADKTYDEVFHHVITRGQHKGEVRGFAWAGMCAVNRDCKIPPVRKYNAALSPDTVSYVGIAEDEPKRLARLDGITKVSLLAKYGMTEADAYKLCQEHGLLSPIYAHCRRNGCWFCPNASDSELLHMVTKHPDMFDRLIEWEKEDNIFHRRLTRRETPSEVKARLLSKSQTGVSSPRNKSEWRFEMAENKNAQQVREITDKLEQGIKELFESERFKEYLRTMSKFYNYSFNNTLLIAMQKPEATYVAGYTSWQRNFERQVMKGEKGIKILAPAPYKAQEEREKIDPVTQKPVIGADGKTVTETVEVLRPAFKVVSVFDVSQTDGKELPDIVVDELKGTVENYEAFFDALRQESPVPISFEDIPGGAKGFFSPVESRIAIQEGMSEIQTVKTAIHEIAHAKLHAVKPDEKAAPEDKKDRHTKEVEAESVAYTVCQRYGIETSDYSFGYIAGWSSGKETKELKSSLDTIRKTAAEMIEGIDAKLKVLLAEKSQSVEQGNRSGGKAGSPHLPRDSELRL